MGQQLELFSRLHAPDDQPASEPLSRVRPRRVRRSKPPHRTVNPAREGKRVLAKGRELYPEAEHSFADRPRTRAECVDGPRPCPFVSCRHHLYLEVNARNGSITFNFPDVDVDELEMMPATCSLDVAARGRVTLITAGRMLSLTRERARQIERGALSALRATSSRADLG